MRIRQAKIIGGISLFVAGVTYIATLTMLNIRHFEDTVVKQTQNHLLTIAQTKARHIEEIINSVQSELEIAATNTYIQKTMIKQTPPGISGEDFRCPLTDILLRLNKVVKKIETIDTSGQILKSLPESKDLKIKSPLEKTDIKHALDSRIALVSEVFKSDQNKNAVSICVPVFHQEDFVGILRAVINLDTINTLTGQVGKGDNNYAWIADTHGNIISHPDETFLGRSVFALKLKQLGDEDAEQRVISGMLNSTKGVTSFVADKRTGDKAMIAWVPIKMKNTKWALAVHIDYDEEIAEPIRMHSQNTFIMLGCFICAFLVAAVMYFRIERRKAHLSAHRAIGRVNDELQLISVERQRTEEQLNTKVNQLKKIVTIFPHAVFWKDKDLKYLGCNTACAALLGLDNPEEIKGKTDTELFWTPEEVETFKNCDAEILKTAIPLLNVEFSRTQPSGTTRTWLTSRLPLTDSQGKISGILGVYTDVTELKAIRNKHDHASANSTDILYNMNHALATVARNYTIIDANPSFAELCQKTVEQILSKNIYEAIPADVAVKLKPLVQNISTAADTRSISLIESINQRDYEITIMPVRHDDEYVGFLLWTVDVTGYPHTHQNTQYPNSKFIANISHNIRTAMNNIVGFTDLLRQDKLTEDQNEFVDMINSSASGLMDIANELAQLTEQPDAQNQNSSTTPKPQHSLNNTDAEDRGVQKDDKTDDNQQPDTDQERILIVDDVEENRVLIDVLMRKAGYNTVLCVNGNEAVKLAQNNRYDLILMDIQMPIMDGLEATKAIRRNGLNTNVPIIAMTASVSKGDELECLEAGCDDYVRKPIKKDLVLRKVWRFIEQVRQIKIAEKGGDIVSFLTNEDDYKKTIEMFVANLPGRLEEMTHAFEQGALKELALKVHALKGLGSFAGFPIFTERAKTLEKTIKEKELDKIAEQIEELHDLCNRTRLAKP